MRVAVQFALGTVLVFMGGTAWGENATTDFTPEEQTLHAAKELLNDPNPTVRLRAALALAEKQDADAVAVLIELLAVLPTAQRRQAEEVLQQLAGEWAPNPALTGEDEVSRRIRRDVWAAWWKHTDGQALLAAFRSQTLTPEDHGRVRGLIEKLGDRSFAARERAAMDLVALGPKAVPLLRQAAQGKDLEIVRRAQACLTQIAENDVKLPLAAARLLALRRPSGAAEALLAYAPFAENEPMLEELAAALQILAAPAGKPEASLVQALTDPTPLRRGLAAEALAKANLVHVFPALRKLLDDPDAGVRLRTALALVRANERQAVEALIRLMGELPADQLWLAQDMLFQLAGENAPQLPTGNDAQVGAKRQAVWEEWWKKHGEALDLAKLTPATTVYGYTLLVQVDPNNNGGRVVELGRDGKPRWMIEGLQFPVDAHMIGNSRVLISEYNGRRVTERDLKGTIVWKKDNLPGSPVNVQRLRNGNTFIATENTLLEVNPAGATVTSHQVGGGVTAACRLPNGQTVCLTQRGTCIRLDTNGKEVKSFASGRGGGWTSGLDLLANGRILIAQPDRNSVAEYDLEGKQVWQASAPSITTASRTPNGNTLVASFDGRRVYELDKTGKQVWEHRENYSVFRARRR